MLTDPAHARFVVASVEARPEFERAGLGWRSARGLGRRGGRVRRGRREPGVDLIEPSRQTASIAVEGATAEPGVARAPIPGDDPIVQGEPQRRQVLVGRGDRRQSLEDGPDVIAEEADQPAQERRRIGRDDHRPVEAGDQSAGHRERVGAGRGCLEDGDGIGGEIGPAGVAPRPRALEQDEARQVAECLGRIDRARAGHTVGQSTEPERRAGSIGRDHLRPMIRRVAWQVRPALSLWLQAAPPRDRTNS